MKRVRRVAKWLGLVLLFLLVVAQFIRPAKTNPVTDQAKVIGAHTQMDHRVAAIIDRSCRDCHSNETRWPWYSQVAPVSWFVIDHVNHGRSHLNFSEWGSYENNERANLLRNICREVRAGVMPLDSYLLLHRGARLSEDDVRVLCDWTSAERARMTDPRSHTNKNNN